MGTIFQIQQPNGFVARYIQAIEPSLFTRQEVEPLWADMTVIPKVNPFVAWTIGDKVTLLDPTPFDVRLLSLDLDNVGTLSARPLSEIQIFAGDVGLEVLVASVSLTEDKRDIQIIQAPIVLAGQRISAAVAYQSDPALETHARLGFCEYVTE